MRIDIPWGPTIMQERIVPDELFTAQAMARFTDPELYRLDSVTKDHLWVEAKVRAAAALLMD